MKNRISKAVAMALALGLLAACSGGSSQPANNNNNSTPAPTKPAAQKKVEIFSWWTGGGEEAGLKALIANFKQQHADIDVINSAVAGAAGTNAKVVLTTRMNGGDPPDTFQVHAGHELLDTWVLAGKMESLNDLYKSEGWDQKFPKQLIDMMSKDGQVYSVAVNIHRSNVLWYNKKVFDQNNLKAPTTWAEFFQVAEALKAKNITPMTLGDKDQFAPLHLFESVLLGSMGTDAYKELFTGKRHWDDPKVKDALQTYAKVIKYVNPDHKAMGWQDAAKLVADGKAAMNIMGDWAKGYFTSDLKLKPNVDFGWAPSPDTKGTFLMLSDSFGLPKNVKDRGEVIDWLKVLGSQTGQDIFNPLKGSIPARTDADKSKYDEYGQSAMADWSSNALAPSIAHGAAASPGFSDKIQNIIDNFTAQGDINQAMTSLKAAEADLKF